MRTRGAFILAAVGLSVLGVFFFLRDDSLKGNPPLAPLHPVETPTPLEISVRWPTEGDHFKISDWQSASDPQPKVTVLVEVKNISKRAIVLPHFTYWMPGLTLTTHSPFVRKPNYFVAALGQLDWVFVAPGKSVLAYDDAANSLTFLASGTYDLDYGVTIDYSYYEGSGGGIGLLASTTG
jgi:hypothetical protein